MPRSRNRRNCSRSDFEGYDLKKLGHNTADYIHTSAEAIKLAFADRDKYLGDLDFIKIPYEGLLSKEYAAERRGLIDQNTASLEFRPGTAEKFARDQTPLDRPLKVTTAGNGDHEGDTSYIAVVDSARNLITFTPSLHSAFGTVWSWATWDLSKLPRRLHTWNRE
jgi:gamma-glutamyltranspeptidase/glutathione hydrolase